jgi:adenine deaminase
MRCGRLKNYLEELLLVARGVAPADVLLKDAQVVNTFVGKVERTGVAIFGEKIAGVGEYTKAKQVIDLKGAFLLPGFINGHTHVESSMLHPARYAQAVVPRGTLTVITDLHEISNVCGEAGIEFFLRWSQKVPLDIFVMVPSCVPATRLETSGARITARKMKRILANPNVIGLGEMMDFPGVVRGEKEVIRKLVIFQDKVIDGHAPGLGGKELNAYLSVGIRSDHECTTCEEAKEKLLRGMYIMIREGSSEKNLDALLPLITENTYKRCLFVVDDRSCSDLVREGDIDAVVRRAISKGLDPVRAICMATINVAEYFRLYDRGAIAPGYLASLITVNDLRKLDVDMVFYRGKLVAKEGKPLFSLPEITAELTHTVRMRRLASELLSLPAKRRKRGEEIYPVIEIVPGQIITRKRKERMAVADGKILPDVERDILKLVVVERHRASGNIGVGLVNGFGLKKGALASSVAHDSHNVVAVGTNDLDILRAIEEVERLQGGLVVCADGNILASLPLPIAGLLSPEPLESVVEQHGKVEQAAASLGNLPPAPFSILSFLALPVIPELRLTDLGLVDVKELRLVN